MITCDECGLEFESPRPEPEALAEMMETFGHIPEQERIVVCTDCYKTLMRRNGHAQTL